MPATDTSSSDQQIIELFWNRDEHAIQTMQTQYDKYLHTIARNILSTDEDCEECKNDAYLALWNSIPPQKPDNLRAYAAKITRNLALNRYHAQNRKKRIPSEYTCSLEELSACLPDDFDTEKAYDQKRLQEIINRYVVSLSKRKQYLFVCRYYCGDPVAQIAKSLGVSQSMVFYELSQIRRKLKALLQKEGFGL